ncbi:MAG: interferon-inducible GTPase-domain-containing protein [Lentinula lateritia]|uniref:Interferon-inducible GTPase-domain-containing protein n=1 Tax=Lentinula lateritia TaxID=40482 RepID=A0ABQ8V8M1_9AGAR|nr:MAG: interferon-inducible GTPase-domain-containing protein [Lentinula lateritia]KAJ4480336.1 interferon-inducible GTPase-domain-containing protein [Lentinula lateritia]
MGSSQSKSAKAAVDEINERKIRQNPIVLRMEKKHQEELESLQKDAEKRAEADEKLRSRQEKQHQKNVVLLQSQLDQEAEARRAAEDLHREAEQKRIKAEQEASDYAKQAEKAQKARDDAVSAAEKARTAMEEAEARAKSEHRARDEAEVERKNAVLSAEEFRDRERSARDAAAKAEEAKEKFQRLEEKARLTSEETEDELQKFKVEREKTEKELARAHRREAQLADLQPVHEPTRAEHEQTKNDRQYIEGRLHLAIAGMAGSGKSSLINAFRGVSKGTASAAATGVVETTRTIGRYEDPHPDRSKFVWYDIPGAGTANVGHTNYFIKQGLYIFDAIIVLFDSRFVDADITILENCKKFNIPAFIVRSKSDEHIKAIADEMREELDEDESEDEDDIRSKDREARRTRIDADAKEEYISVTRQNVRENLQRAGLDEEQRIYLISRRTLLRIVRGKQVAQTKLIDEYELIKDVMAAIKERRIDPPPPFKADPAKSGSYLNPFSWGGWGRR